MKKSAPRETAKSERARDLAARPRAQARTASVEAHEHARAEPAHEAAAPAPSLLTRLAPGASERAPDALARAFHQASGEQPGELPLRAELEERLGRAIGPVSVYAGARTRSLLDYLGAASAVHGRQLFLRTRSPDIVTLTHEVVHVLQASRHVVAPGLPLTLVSEGHHAEREAESVAQALWRAPSGARQLPVISARLGPGALALRRLDLAADERARRALEQENEPQGGTRRARRGRADREPGEPSTEQRAQRESEPAPVQDAGRAAQTGAAAGARAIEPAARAPAARGDQPPGEQAPAPERGGPTGERAPGPEPAGLRSAANPGCEINPRARYRELVERVQDAWDRGADQAQTHEVELCPQTVEAPGALPFATGPPAPLAPIRETTSPEDPQPVAVDEQGLLRARAELDNAVGEARTAQIDRSGIAPEVDRLRAQHSRDVQEQVGDLITRDAPTARAQGPPHVELGDEADPSAALAQGGALAARLTQSCEQAVAQASGPAFGDQRLAPREDPRAGLDPQLAQLAPATLEASQLLPESTLETVPTADNVGQVALEDLRLVREQDLADVQAQLEAGPSPEQQVQEELARGDAALDAMCREAGQERGALERTTEDGVTTRRAELRSELEGHTARRTAEGASLTRDKRAHIEELRGDADRRAADTLQGAEREAEQRWGDTERRARREAEQSEGRSLWEQTVDLVRAGIARLLDGIRAFVAACRRAVRALLEAARRVAHAVIEAARRAIARSIELLRAGLDLIADNIPGELGRIAGRFRDRIAAFLSDAQAQLDRWATALHGAVDRAIEALRSGIDLLLSTIERGYAALLNGLDALLQQGLMSFLRAQFPAIAALIDEGLLAPIRQAGEALDQWVQQLIEQSGLLELEATLLEIEHSGICQPTTPEEQADLCHAFEQVMQGLLAEFDRLLASPFARDLQRSLTASRNAALDEQVGLLDSLFSFAQSAASQVLTWWNAIEQAINGLYQVLGGYVCAIWRHIAAFLDLPIDLDPITALRQALEALWADAIALVQPILDGLREAWRWLCEETFLATLFELIDMVRRAWDQLGRLWDWFLAEGEAFLVALARAAEANIIAPLRALLAELGRLMHQVADAIHEFARGLTERLEALLAWLTDIPILGALVRLLRALLAPLRTLSAIALECLIAFLHLQAEVVGNLLHYLRVFADIVVGLMLAFTAPPLTIALFLAGNVWLRLVPDCYKLAIINFLLDVVIRVIEFFPAPADIALFVLYEAGKRFLRYLRDDDTDRKVRAVDLVARIFAGDLEIGAGMFVGVLEAIWDSTVGLVIMLIQALAWLMALPLRLLGFGAGDSDAPEAPEQISEQTEAAGEQAGDDAEAVTVGPPRDEEQRPTGDDVGPDNQSESSGGFDPTRPPALPPELARVRDVLEGFVSQRFTREDLQRLLQEFRDGLRDSIGPLAKRGAESLLGAMTAEGAGFSVGRVIGYAIGLVLVIVLLAIFTGPGAAAGGAGGLSGALGSAGRSGVGGARALAQALPRIRAALQPLLQNLGRVVPQIRSFLQPIWPWIDDVLRWLRVIVRGARTIWRSLPPWLRELISTWARWKLIAETRAAAAWRALSADLQNEAIDSGDLRRRLLLIRATVGQTMPPGLKLRLRAEFDTDDDHWQLKATVRRSIFARNTGLTRVLSASGHAGPGWLGSDLDDDPWFSTAGSQEQRHSAVFEAADRLLESAAARENEPGTDAHTVYDRLLEGDVEGAEQGARGQLLENVVLVIERHFETGVDEQGLPALLFNFVITPNTDAHETPVAIPADTARSSSPVPGEQRALRNYEAFIREEIGSIRGSNRGLARAQLTGIVGRARVSSEARYFGIDSELRANSVNIEIWSGSHNIAPRITVRRPRPPTGTQSDPIPITWFKPFNVYGRIDLSPERGERATLVDLWGQRPDGAPDVPDTLRVLRIRDVASLRVPQDLQHDLAGATAELGVHERYQPQLGATIMRIQGEPRINDDFPTALTMSYRALLIIYGWLRASRYQIDHVKDLGFCGDDRLDNLWPLEAGVNQAANAVYRQRVYIDFDGVARERAPLTLSGLYFRVANIRRP